MQKWMLLLITVVLCRAQTLNWQELSPSQSPPARGYQAVAYDSAHQQLVLFGGESPSGTCLGDTWVWNGSSWTQQFPLTSPPARCEHTLAYDAAHDEVVLFGGTTSDPFGSILADTWTWNGNNWTQRFPATTPTQRQDHAMAYDSVHNNVVMFGGITSTSDAVPLNDTWIWNGSNWMEQNASSPPPPRSGHTMAFDAALGQVVMFGGIGVGNVVYGDLWVWTGATWTLKEVQNSVARTRHAMAYDPARSVIVIFGGYSATANLNDTWQFDGNVWTEVFPTTCPGYGAPPCSGTYGSSMAYDVASAQLILFGGVPNYYPQACCGSSGGTWTFGVVGPSCNPPSMATIDASETEGLISASMSTPEISNGQLTAHITIANPLRFWLGLLAESQSAGASFQPTPSLLTPCGSPPFVAGCPDTGGATFTVQFCSPGSITLEYGETPTSAGATYVDAVAPVSTQTIIGLVTNLQTVPDWVALQQCFSNLGLQTPGCLTIGTFRLLSNRTQFQEVVTAFAKAGVSVDIASLINALTLFLGSGETLEDLLLYVSETSRAGHLDTVSLKIVGK